MRRPIQPGFRLLPPRHHLPHQPVEALAMVVLGDVAKLVQDHIVNAFARGFNQVGVQGDSAIG